MRLDPFFHMLGYVATRKKIRASFLSKVSLYLHCSPQTHYDKDADALNSATNAHTFDALESS